MKTLTFTAYAQLGLAVFFSLVMTAQPLRAFGEIINLSGEDFEMGVLLSWSTSTETNNKEFWVERSSDGVHFTTIGNVRAVGNATVQQDYRFLDVAAQKGSHQYRLKLIKHDETFVHSEPIVVNKGIANNFTIISMTPLEGENTVEITLDVQKSTEITYLVERLGGSLVYMGNQPLMKGLNIVTVDVSQLEIGTYRITLKGEEETETVTFKTQKRMDVRKFADFDDGE